MSAGKVAYDAFQTFHGEIKPWEGLWQHDRDAWGAAAEAVLKQCAPPPMPGPNFIEFKFDGNLLPGEWRMAFDESRHCVRIVVKHNLQSQLWNGVESVAYVEMMAAARHLLECLLTGEAE